LHTRHGCTTDYHRLRLPARSTCYTLRFILLRYGSTLLPGYLPAQVGPSVLPRGSTTFHLPFPGLTHAHARTRWVTRRAAQFARTGYRLDTVTTAAPPAHVTYRLHAGCSPPGLPHYRDCHRVPSYHTLPAFAVTGLPVLRPYPLRVVRNYGSLPRDTRTYHRCTFLHRSHVGPAWCHSTAVTGWTHSLPFHHTDTLGFRMAGFSHTFPPSHLPAYVFAFSFTLHTPFCTTPDATLFPTTFSCHSGPPPPAHFWTALGLGHCTLHCWPLVYLPILQDPGFTCYTFILHSHVLYTLHTHSRCLFAALTFSAYLHAAPAVLLRFPTTTPVPAPLQVAGFTAATRCLVRLLRRFTAAHLLLPLPPPPAHTHTPRCRFSFARTPAPPSPLLRLLHCAGFLTVWDSAPACRIPLPHHLLPHNSCRTATTAHAPAHLRWDVHYGVTYDF